MLTAAVNLVDVSMLKYFGTTTPIPSDYDSSISLERELIKLVNEIAILSGNWSWHVYYSLGPVEAALDVYIRSIKYSLNIDRNLLLSPLVGYLNNTVKTKSELYRLIYDQRYQHRLSRVHKQMSYLVIDEIKPRRI